jgi:hypothetical protein
VSEIIFHLDLPDHEFPIEVRVGNSPNQLDQFVQALNDTALEAAKVRVKLYDLETYPAKHIPKS